MFSITGDVKMFDIFFSSGIVWEIGKKKRFKALKMKQCTAIEAAYQQYQNELAVGSKPKSRKVIEKIEVSSTLSQVTRLNYCLS